MTPDELLRIENEVFTKIVIDELQNQKKEGRKIDEYVLDKYKIDVLTKERLKKFLGERG